MSPENINIATESVDTRFRPQRSSLHYSWLRGVSVYLAVIRGSSL